MRHATWLLGVVGLAACGPETDQRPLLLLDAKARASGFELKVGDWSGAPVTPISVTPMDDVVLKGPTGTQHLMPRPGTLGLIEGPGGALRWRSMSEELDPRQLTVRGDAEAVRHLATMLDARAVRLRDEQWTLEADAVLEQSAWLDVPTGVSEVAVVERSGPVPLQVPTQTFQVGGVAPSSVQLVDEVPAFVGTYLSDDGALVLDASGGYQLMQECDLSAGHFYVAGGSLVLVPDDGPRRELAIGSDGELGDPFGHFAALRLEAP